MTAIELKRVLIRRITEIEDISFLRAIKTILESKASTDILALTPEQRDEIMESKKELSQGLFMEHELLNREVSKWLGAR